jgi:pyruvate/2-oxoglutarate dehydrogenase complex dihydrolipoamide dehydrogenase (E3) component
MRTWNTWVQDIRERAMLADRMRAALQSRTHVVEKKMVGGYCWMRGSIWRLAMFSRFRQRRSSARS